MYRVYTVSTNSTIKLPALTSILVIADPKIILKSQVVQTVEPENHDPSYVFKLVTYTNWNGNTKIAHTIAYARKKYIKMVNQGWLVASHI